MREVLGVEWPLMTLPRRVLIPGDVTVFNKDGRDRGYYI